MDLSEIKKLIENEGGKVIIVENNEPVMIITSFDEYKKKKLEPSVRNASHSDAGGESKEEELKIEDLPF